MAEARPRVLVIDDGEIYARAVAEHMPELALLTPAGSTAGRFSDGPSALRYLDKSARGVDIVLLDMQFDVDDTRLAAAAGGQLAAAHPPVPGHRHPAQDPRALPGPSGRAVHVARRPRTD